MWQYLSTPWSNMERHLSYVPRTLVPLPDYCVGMPIVSTFTPPGAMPLGTKNDGSLIMPEYRLLAEPAQAVARGTMLVLDDLFGAGLCLKDITPKTFLVDPADRSVYLSKEGWEATDFLSSSPTSGCLEVDVSVKLLADHLEDCLFVANKLSALLVDEVGVGLLPMMRMAGNDMWYAILNHCSLVPVGNRRELFLRTYDQLVQVVADRSRAEYSAILEELVFPSDWHNLATPENNSVLFLLYQGAVYDSTAEHKGEQAEHIGRFMRNSSTHVLQAAGRRIGRTDISLLHHSMAPLYLASLQRGLQKRGWLASTEIHTLFVYGRAHRTSGY